MSYVDSVIEQVKAKNANEPEFIQAVTEVLTSLKPVIEAHPEYEKAGLLERIVEPERVIMFSMLTHAFALSYVRQHRLVVLRQKEFR